MNDRHKNGHDSRIHILEVLGNAIVGGMENYVRNLLRRLPADEFRVTCLCPFESAVTADLRAAGYPVFIAAMEEDPPWRSLQTAVEIIHQCEIDLLHAHLTKGHVLAGLAGCVTHKPVVATIHEKTVTTHELGIKRLTGSHVIVVCQEAYMQALALGIPAADVTLIRNGVDLTRFTPEAGGGQFRTAVGIPADAPLVGFIGRLAPEKGPDHFVRAARHVHRSRPEAHFVLVGEGPMAQELRDMVQAMGLSDRVHLDGLWSDVSQVYPALDILAQTSRAEGMPLALLEGMACGRPVVAIGVGGVLELVEVGSTGLIAGPGDWQGVGNLLLELLAHPQQREEMGRAARRRAEALFDLQDSARATAALFHELVGRAPQERPSPRRHAALGNGRR